MDIILKELNTDHMPLIYDIIRREQPFSAGLIPQQFAEMYNGCEGWVVIDQSLLTQDTQTFTLGIVGVVMLTNFQPLHCATMHAVIDHNYHGKWLNKEIIRDVFRYLFLDLQLIKVRSYVIYGVTYRAAKALDSLGFKREGIDRRGCIVWDGKSYTPYDIVNYGLLREECRWL
jgi:RimJ/RimL family protein N-acetyltransferase